ncbi:hypothetical protein EV401DRAFT_2038196 [Pisolithus croceorrhizus]|nr:hypothetical protein EV401DRAFT_2038196 [Pisolithus croceorrhizus]
MEEFLMEMACTFPKALVQLEDKVPLSGTFNHSRLPLIDDAIQGAGAVVLAVGFPSLTPKDHRFLFYGAGCGGVGVAKQVLVFFTLNKA